MSPIPILTGPSVPPLAGGAPTALVVLLHGYGSNGQDLIGLVPHWREALPHTQFLSPDAPEPCPGAPGGFQWWGLSATRTSAERAAGVARPAAALNGFLDQQLARLGLAEDRLALVGFSQGTMEALHVGPRRATPIAGILGYSGALADPDALAAEVKSKPPVRLIHADAVVPLEEMDHAKAALDALGFAVDAHVRPGLGHGIDEAGLELGRDFLVERLG
jgi:phospholipase/carboxylesterase